MKIGVVGLGGIFEVAYWPAFQQFQIEYPDQPIQLFGYDPKYSAEPSLASPFPNLTFATSYSDLLSFDLDLLLILTPPETHYDLVVEALQSGTTSIVIEKPVVANLEQLAQLRRLLQDQAYATRVLALDHWSGRNGIQTLVNHQLDGSWQLQTEHSSTDCVPDIPIIEPQDILNVEGYLLEPCGFNQQGEPIALNFATGLEDSRQFFHPDGVILDIGTHVLTMMREFLAQYCSNHSLQLQAKVARDRLGNDIASGDVKTAEGEALLEGHCGSVPIRLHLNKYAGLEGGQKGMTVDLVGGRRLILDRQGADELMIYCDGKQHWQWIRYGSLYQHTIFDLLLNLPLAGNVIASMTSRRMDEVHSLLNIQQGLRGKH
ncbi:Gfo/Idh/MocA family oxidoreductase [Vibrio rumoiensis]|uniref:Gfo/Idh/MocA family oxidoreductase n=1 Tax=Vibrio rumoiensis TaxID=76258 RepID=UPI000B5C5DDC|nr:Gfo/Idh/MocA family oxidoreductase [Vibrio rumoiensis]